MRRLVPLLLVLLSGCATTLTPPAPSPTPQPSLSASPSGTAAQTVEVSSPPPPSGVWRDIGSGVELREQSAAVDGLTARVTVTRMASAAGRLRVGYAPTAPASITDWAAAHPSAVAMVNGGYFDQDNRTTSLLVSDGTRAGASYSGFGGMLSMAADGTLRLRSLHDHPYSSSEKPREAVQSFPMLVVDGAATSLPNDNGSPGRRTVVAVDATGALLFIVVQGLWTLPQTGRWLAASDLGLRQALNLDGGSSTAMAVRGATTALTIESYTPLPIVVWVDAP